MFGGRGRWLTRFALPVTTGAVILVATAWGASAWSITPGPPYASIEGPGTRISNAHGVAVDQEGLVYVASIDGDRVTAHRVAPGLSYGPPVKVLEGPSTRLRGPRDVAFDDQGRMYVLTSSAVHVFAADWASGNTAPIKSLSGASTGLVDSRSLDFDSVGRMYVVNSYGFRDGAGSITVYQEDWPDGDTSPMSILKGRDSGLDFPYGIAFDEAGLTYVTNRNSITVYSASWLSGAAVPMLTMRGSATGLIRPEGIAFDDEGFMYVANAGGPEDASLTIYSPGWAQGRTGWPSADLGAILARGLPPIATIRGAASGLDEPRQIFIDDSGRLYIASGGGQRLVVHEPALQVITLRTPAAIEYQQRMLEVRPEATSGLPVVIESLTPGICAGSGIGQATLEVRDVGTCILESRQDGNDQWSRAPVVRTTIEIRPSTQIVSIGRVSGVVLSDTAIRISASTTSGLPVIWTTSTPSTCLAKGPFGRKVVLVAVGSCSLTATQPGNRYWYSASAGASFEVREATQEPDRSMAVSCKAAGSGPSRFIRCTGSSTGFPEGTRLQAFWKRTPRETWIKVSEDQAPVVGQDGNITWRLTTPNSSAPRVYFALEDFRTAAITARPT